MKIAFTTTGEGWDAAIDPRFGRTDFIFVYDEEKDESQLIDNRSVSQMEHGVGPKTAQMINDLGAGIVITGNGPGGNAATVLNQMNVKVYIRAGGMSVKEAYEAYKQGKLPIGG